MKVLLAFPKNIDTQGTTSNGCFPPLGLLAIATYFKNCGVNAEISIVDEEVTEGPSWSQLTQVDIVGIYCNSLTYPRAIAIAKIAKDNGAFVVVGGPHANARAKQILARQECVDAVVIGEGEVPILQIVKGHSFPTIAGLVYREGDKIIQNPTKSSGDCLLVDFSFVDLKPYWSNWRKTFPEKNEFHSPIPVMIQRGCSYRLSHGPCIFCSTPQQNLKRISPHEFWQYIVDLSHQYPVDYIRDNSDDPFRDENYVSALCETKPHSDTPAMRFYCRADTITPHLIANMRTLNVTDVFIGFESGSDEILVRSNKGSSRIINLRAAQLLAQASINVIPSFVLGLLGESMKTLQMTIDHINEIRNITSAKRPGCAILIPFPGSTAFNMMMKIPRMHAKYDHLDVIDYNEIRKDWMAAFTDITYEKLIEISDSLFVEGIIGSRMGAKVSDGK